MNISKISKSSIVYACAMALGCLYFIAIPASADGPPDPPNSNNSQQFEQWLQKNGFSGPAPVPGQLPTTPPPLAAEGSPPPAVPKPPEKNHLVPHQPTLQESQQAMLDSIPPPTNPPGPESQKAFDMLLQQNMPLSTDQVVQLHQQVDLAQRAAAVPATIPPKPVSTTIMINLAPGSTPPAVRLAQGYVTSLVFVDSTGAPWPVAAYEIGNPKATNMQWDGKSNILLMQAVSPYSSGNLVIRLVNLPTPITLELISGQRVVDYRVDLHMAGIGPNAKDIPKGVSLPGSANLLLLNILDGVSPPGSKTLVVKGGDCQAWLAGDKMYLRTRFTILSPGWVGKMTSSDGMQAYELPRSASVLISRYGEPVELKVEGF